MDRDSRPAQSWDKPRIEAWIEEARDGSPTALGYLLQACERYLTDLAGRRVASSLRCKVSPSDLVQETSLDFESLPRIESPLFQVSTIQNRNSWAMSDDFRYAAFPTRPERATVFDVESGSAVATLEVPGLLGPLSFSKNDPLLLCGYAGNAESV